MTWGCKPENKPDGCGWANWQIELPGMRDWWCDLCERSGEHMVHKGTYSLPVANDAAATFSAAAKEKSDEH